MDQEKKHAVALMRYSAIAPLITGLSNEYEPLTDFFNAASVKGVKSATTSSTGGLL